MKIPIQIDDRMAALERRSIYAALRAAARKQRREPIA
jgi:hypothetical protein